jgi:predicted DNA-binding transcriptional regulator AlpA
MNDVEKQAIIKMFKNSELFRAIKQEFDRSFFITIDRNQEGRLLVAVEEKDTGSSVMTVGDVAAFLQTDRPSVRRMTRERAQRQSRHPLPFVKLGQKMIRFYRADIEK